MADLTRANSADFLHLTMLTSETVTHCPWCQSSASEVVYENLNDRVFKVVDFSTSLLKCSDCGSAYISPRPTRDSIHLAYQNYYTQGYTPPSLSALPLWSRIKLSLYNGFRNHHYKSSFSPSCSLGRFIYSLFPSKLKALNEEMRYIPAQRSNASNAVLDVGCGNCGYLHMLCRGGWEAYGCDFDETILNSQANHILRLRNGLSSAWLDHAGFFSCIVSSHVLEHLHDPFSELEYFFKLLEPGGFLYLELPNVDSWVFSIYGKDWLGLDVPRHLSLPSLSQLKSSLLSIGFTRISQVTRSSSAHRHSWRMHKGLDYRDSSRDHEYTPHNHHQIYNLERPDFLALTCIKPLNYD